MIGHPGAHDKRLARLVEHRWAHGPALAEGPVRVATQTLRISHSPQEQIEGASLMTELIDLAFPDQALIHPADLVRDGAESGQRERMFGHPGYWICSHDTGHMWEASSPYRSQDL